MQNPDEIPYVRRRLDMATVLVPELQSVLQAIFQCADSGQPLNLTTLQQLLDDKAFQQLALAMAQNHDAPLQHQDIDMYLDRLESARPLDEKVRQMDDSQFSDFLPTWAKRRVPRLKNQKNNDIPTDLLQQYKNQKGEPTYGREERLDPHAD